MKTKALIRCAVTDQLICAFVLAYAKRRFSHDAAHIMYIVWNSEGFACLAKLYQHNDTLQGLALNRN